MGEGNWVGFRGNKNDGLGEWVGAVPKPQPITMARFNGVEGEHGQTDGRTEGGSDERLGECCRALWQQSGDH